MANFPIELSAIISILNYTIFSGYAMITMTGKIRGAGAIKINFFVYFFKSLVLLFICAAINIHMIPPAIADDIVESKVVPSGIQREMAFATIVDEQCNQPLDVNKMIVRIIQKPLHGTIEIRNGYNNPNFPYFSTSRLCNFKKFKGIYVFYKSHIGYIGHDNIIINMTTPSGQIMHKRIEIEVR